jgi:hypothetical protein
MVHPNPWVWINSLAHNYDKTLGYFQMLDGKHVVFGNAINGLTLYTKLKLKGCKMNMLEENHSG